MEEHAPGPHDSDGSGLVGMQAGPRCGVAGES